MCYYNPDHYCDMIDKECILHIPSTLPIYPQAPFSLSLPLSPPLLSPSAQSTSSTSLLSLLLVRMSIDTSTLSYLRYLRYPSQVHVTKKKCMPKVQGREKYMYLPGMYVCMYVGTDETPKYQQRKKRKNKELHGFCGWV